MKTLKDWKQFNEQINRGGWISDTTAPKTTDYITPEDYEIEKTDDYNYIFGVQTSAERVLSDDILSECSSIEELCKKLKENGFDVGDWLESEYNSSLTDEDKVLDFEETFTRYIESEHEGWEEFLNKISQDDLVDLVLNQTESMESYDLLKDSFNETKLENVIDVDNIKSIRIIGEDFDEDSQFHIEVTTDHLLNLEEVERIKMFLEEKLEDFEEDFNKINIGNSLRLHVWIEKPDYKTEIRLLYPTEIPE
jgi:hypothetical protein